GLDRSRCRRRYGRSWSASGDGKPAASHLRFARARSGIARVCGLVAVAGCKLLPGILLREHGAQIGDVRVGLLLRQFAPGDLLRLGETSLKPDDQGEVLAYAAVGRGLRGGRAKIGFGRLEIACEDIGHAEIGENGRLVRLQV